MFIDGSYGEGGGAIVRTGLALATYYGKDLIIDKIRAGRKSPGLKAQHVAAVNLLKDLCKAKCEVSVGEQKLEFVPGKVKSGNYEVNIGTAGSISLLLQAVLLPCFKAKGKVSLEISGGTCGKWQTGVDYMQQVLFPQLRRFGNVEMIILKRGYYPKGGGKVKVEVRAKKEVVAFSLLEQGKLEQIKGVVNTSLGVDGNRVVRAAEISLKKLGVPIQIDVQESNTESKGGEVMLWAVFSRENDIDVINPVRLGADRLIEGSLEEVGRSVANDLLEEIKSGGAVDQYLADMLIPFMAVLPGSEIKVSKITEHTRTNIWLCEQLLPVKFKVDGQVIRVD